MKSRNKLGAKAALLVGLLALGGCVTAPQGPTIPVMPGTGKSLEQFQVDSGICRQFAQSSIGGATQAAQDTAAANVAGGAAVGAAVGALLGAATGQSGSGAAWGAGTGVMFGGAAAGGSSATSSYSLQRQYDIAYMQCMYARGNQVPMRVAPRTVPWTGTAPPAGYSVPPDALTPPPGTPAPAGVVAPR